MTFHQCKVCNQVYLNLHQKNEASCCNEVLEQLIPNVDESEIIHHQPSIRQAGRLLTIKVPNDHPMLDVHQIEFICISTNEGIQIKKPPLNGQATSDFILARHEVVHVAYVYCNIHGLYALTLNQTES